MPTRTTTDYTGRTVDLELAKSVTQLSQEYEQVSLGIANFTPKVVTGLAKLAQRYAVLLLSILDDATRAYVSQGTSLVSNILAGGARSPGYLRHLFAFSNNEVQRQLREENEDEILGDVPDDERLSSAELIDYEVNAGAGTVSLYVQLTSAAGETATFVVPTTVPRTSI